MVQPYNVVCYCWQLIIWPIMRSRFYFFIDSSFQFEQDSCPAWLCRMWMVFWCAKLQFTWCRWDALGPVSDVLEVGEEVVEGDAGGGRQVGAQARERDPWLEGARLRPDPGVGDKWQRRLDCEVKGNSCQNFKPNSGSSALCFWKAMQLYDQWSMCMIARMWGIF